jgi:hypothetical protein
MTAEAEDLPNEWLLGPAGSCIQFLADEIVFLGTVERAFLALPIALTLFQIFEKSALNTTPKEVLDKFATMTAEAADVAQRQLEEGMQSAHANACVACWAAIETTIEQTLVNHLLKLPQAIDMVRRSYPEVKSVAVVDADSARAFLRAWTARLDSTDVVERAMKMLAVFDLDFQLEEKHRRCLTELSEYRNIAVHRRGVVDARFVRKVPWSKVGIGETYQVSKPALLEFHEACSKFCVALIGRLTKSPWIYTKG